MARVLTVHRTIAPRRDRATYLERLRAKKIYYESRQCRFWVFEEAGLSGAFLEFTEAGDAETLSAAHQNAPDGILDPSRIYREVELK